MNVIKQALFEAYDYLYKLGYFTDPTEEGRRVEVLLTQAKIQTNELFALPVVTKAYKFPNGMIATFHGDDQIPELQGRDTPELRDKIKLCSNENTVLHGF